jgi:hypothetical protein
LRRCGKSTCFIADVENPLVLPLRENGSCVYAPMEKELLSFFPVLLNASTQALDDPPHFVGILLQNANVMLQVALTLGSLRQLWLEALKVHTLQFKYYINKNILYNANTYEYYLFFTNFCPLSLSLE